MAMDEYTLPSDISEWRADAKEFKLLTKSVHAYDGRKMQSASNAGLEQFLLLRAYWHPELSLNHFKSHYTTQNWIQKTSIEQAREALRKSTSWEIYLSSFGSDFRNAQFEGTFALVRYYQHLSSQSKTQASTETPHSKVYFTRSRARAEAEAAAQITPSKRPKQPQTPPGKEITLDGLESSFEALSVGRTPLTDKYNAFSTPLYSMLPKPEELDDAAWYGAIKDEQIVNTALIAFLNALTLHCQSTRMVEWSLHRKPFIVTSPNGCKVFEARVDGVFEHQGSKTAAIVEVKPMARIEEGSTATSNKIRIQETAQMAAWIASHPPESALQQSAFNLRSKNTKSKHRRLLVSQDRHEILLVVAEFDDDYVHYIRGMPNTGESFLEMKEYGPYNVTERLHMQILGGILLAISIQGGIL